VSGDGVNSEIKNGQLKRNWSPKGVWKRREKQNITFVGQVNKKKNTPTNQTLDVRSPSEALGTQRKNQWRGWKGDNEKDPSSPAESFGGKVGNL